MFVVLETITLEENLFSKDFKLEQGDSIGTKA
jgi:hypothetical protein